MGSNIEAKGNMYAESDMIRYIIFKSTCFSNSFSTAYFFFKQFSWDNLKRLFTNVQQQPTDFQNIQSANRRWSFKVSIQWWHSPWYVLKLTFTSTSWRRHIVYYLSLSNVDHLTYCQEYLVIGTLSNNVKVAVNKSPTLHLPRDMREQTTGPKYHQMCKDFNQILEFGDLLFRHVRHWYIHLGNFEKPISVWLDGETIVLQSTALTALL